MMVSWYFDEDGFMVTGQLKTGRAVIPFTIPGVSEKYWWLDYVPEYRREPGQPGEE